MGSVERVVVVSVLSERDRRVLAAAEASLLEHDEALVRAFDDLARNDPAAEPAPVPRVAEPEPAAPVAASRRLRSARLLRVLSALGFVGTLAVGGWIFAVGDPRLRLLVGLFVLPVLVLTAFSVVLVGRRGERRDQS